MCYDLWACHSSWWILWKHFNEGNRSTTKFQRGWRTGTSAMKDYRLRRKKLSVSLWSHWLVAVVIDLLCRHFGRHVVLAWSLHYTYSGALLKRSSMSCNMYVMSWLARKLRHGDLQKEIHPRKQIIIGIRQSVAVSLRKKKRRNGRLFEIFNAWNRFSLLYICLI